MPMRTIDWLRRVIYSICHERLGAASRQTERSTEKLLSSWHAAKYQGHRWELRSVSLLAQMNQASYNSPYARIEVVGCCDHGQ
jgi:hypothetical protein